jgi:hypothetical protein
MIGHNEYKEYQVQKIPMHSILDGFIIPNGTFVHKPQRTSHSAEYGIETLDNPSQYEELRGLSHVAIIGEGFDKNGEQTDKIYKARYVRVGGNRSRYYETPVWIIHTLINDDERWEVLCGGAIQRNNLRMSVPSGMNGVIFKGDWMHIDGSNYSFALDKDKDPHILKYAGSSPGSEIHINEEITYRAAFYLDISRVNAYTMIRRIDKSGGVRDALFLSNKFNIRDKYGYADRNKIIEAFNKYV